MTCKEHPKYELPNTPHAKHRYESAMKHVEAAKAAGKSSEEIHAIFKKVMEFDIKDVEKLPADGPHAKYRSAAGKSSEEAHELYRKIMAGEATGGCGHH